MTRTEAPNKMPYNCPLEFVGAFADIVPEEVFQNESFRLNDAGAKDRDQK